MRSLLALYAVAASLQPLAGADGTVSAAFDDFGGANIAFASTVVALALMLLGLVLTFAGRRYLRASVFVGALIGGGFAMASGVIDAAIARDSDSFFSSSSSSSGASPALAALASWVGFFTCGCAIGAVASGFHQRIAYALIGGFSGVVVAFIVHLAWDHFVLLAVVLGAAFGAVATGWEEPPAALVIIPTSVAGSALVMLGVAFFSGGFPTTFELVKFWARAKLRGSWLDAVPGSWWRFFAAFLTLAVVGAVVQFVMERTRGKADRQRQEAAAAAGDEDARLSTQ